MHISHDFIVNETLP